MVLGYHLLISAYGFWLPNEPRGSWSDFVRKSELALYGQATKVDTRRSVAHRPQDRHWKKDAQTALEYPAVVFTGVQCREIGQAFASEAKKCGYIIWACAILPKHLHLVVARHHYNAERIILRLKAAATTRLIEKELHPLREFRDPESGKYPRCWSQGGWRVYLNTVEDILRSIKYVEENPLKEGKPRQTWKCVTPFQTPGIV
jgi:REP element-mobilizing transposase RayT